MTESAIFLSVKPRYARAILAGDKTVELRRTRPQELRRGSLIVLYASSPVQAVLGTAQVDRIVSTSPEALWSMVEMAAGVTREEFDLYFQGAGEAVGIFIDSPAVAPDPYALRDIRRDWPTFHPPQAFRYLRSMGEWATHLLSRLQVRAEDDVPPEVWPLEPRALTRDPAIRIR
jgi:predicted transcriptional regulator